MSSSSSQVVSVDVHGGRAYTRGWLSGGTTVRFRFKHSVYGPNDVPRTMEFEFCIVNADDYSTKNWNSVAAGDAHTHLNCHLSDGCSGSITFEKCENEEPMMVFMRMERNGNSQTYRVPHSAFARLLKLSLKSALEEGKVVFASDELSTDDPHYTSE